MVSSGRGSRGDDFVSVRTSRRGDICVLLTPAENEMPPALQRHLDDIRNLIGGHPPEHIHITAQRFDGSDDAAASRLLDAFQRVVRRQSTLLKPLPVLAEGYISVHSEFRNLHLLKWVIAGSDTLEMFYRMVDHFGRSEGIKPLYLRRGIGARVTAMLDIAPKDDPALDRILIPEPLFVIRKLSVTRIIASGEYELIGEVML